MSILQSKKEWPPKYEVAIIKRLINSLRHLYFDTLLKSNFNISLISQEKWHTVKLKLFEFDIILCSKLRNQEKWI